MWQHVRSGRIGALVISAIMVALASPASGQDVGGDLTSAYEREVFRYPGWERTDPFRSLIRQGEVGVRTEDLILRGILYQADQTLSVAVLTQRGSDRRIQARVGERVGTVRVLAIYPDRVDVVVEELGVARRETLRMERTQSPTGAR